MMTHDEMITVIEADREGLLLQVRKVKSRSGYEDRWQDRNNSSRQSGFNFRECEYRIKPPPREWWISPECGAVTFVSPTEQPGWIHVREVLD